jgi:hypothetical protein
MCTVFQDVIIFLIMLTLYLECRWVSFSVSEYVAKCTYRVARSFELCQILVEPAFCIFLYTIENSFFNISSNLGFLVPREKSTKSCSFCQSCCIKMPNFLNRSKLNGSLLSFYLALSFAKMKVQPKNLMKSISQTSETWDYRFRVLRYLIFAVKSVGFQSTHYLLIYQDPT